MNVVGLLKNPVSMAQVKSAWRSTASQRGYFMGWNLKTLLVNRAGHEAWFKEAKVADIGNNDVVRNAAYLSPSYFDVSNDVEFDGIVGAQEISWHPSGSFNGATHAEPTLEDFPAVEAALVNHSEVIAYQGRTLEQAAAQVRALLDATKNGLTYKFITICVGEERDLHFRDISEAQKTTLAVRYVKKQVRTILELAEVTEEEMHRIGFAYEPRGAIQVGEVKGKTPSIEHCRALGWATLQAVAEVVGLEGMRQMFTLQYGGSMKGPEDETNAVQRFVGPGNEVDEDLFNGGLVGTASKKVETVVSINVQLNPER
ncbi:MAG: triose-phosphate isomerase [bacterium]